MADIESIYPEIRRSIAMLDEPTMQDAILRAARIFCRKTWYCRREINFECLPPGQPQNVIASIGSGQVALTWSPVRNANSYNVWYSTTPGAEASGVNGFANSAGLITGLQNSTEYYFIVQAVNGVGTSLNSSEVAATPLSSGVTSPILVGGTPGDASYSQMLEIESEVAVGVRRASCAGFPVYPASAADMSPLVGSGRPRAFAFAPNGKIIVYPPPNSNWVVETMTAVQPVVGSLQIPDEIAENYAETIGYGALAWIYTMAGPWKDMNMAKDMGELFSAGVSNAKLEALSDFQSGNMRVIPVPFIISRSTSW